MIRSLAGCARCFLLRVGRHCRRTAGLSSETRRRLIRRGSLGLAVLRLRPSRRGASATDVRQPYLPDRVPEIRGLLPRRRSALTRPVSTARLWPGREEVWAPLSRHAHRLLTEPRAQASARPGLGSIAIYASCEIPASALPPARFHLTRDFSIRRCSGAILFYSAARIACKLKEANFTPNSRRWI